MKEADIINLFTNVLNERTAIKVLGLTKHDVSNYRNKNLPSIGTMLEILMRADLIKITKNESEGSA